MLGLATIGQSPRDDVVSSMFGDAVPPMLQAGALDGLSRSQIAGLIPRAGEHPLVTRLLDGTEVVIAKERVTPLLQAAVGALAANGADLVCVLCTGEFTGLHVPVRLIFPDKLLTGIVDAILPEGTIGAIIPHEGQSDSMRRKWSGNQRGVEIAVASPYLDAESFGHKAATLGGRGAELIVMDCMGYSLAMRAEAQSAVGVPVLLANRMVGSVLQALAPSLPVALDHAARL